MGKKKGRTILMAFRIILFLTPGFALSAQDISSRLVTPDWLAAQVKNPDIRIIDMRADIREYWESHIPGAIFLDSESLRWPERGVPSKLMPPAVMAQLLGQMGIDRKTTVIVYSEINNYRATYLVWTLDLMGHKGWAVLENGFVGWKQRNLPITQDYPSLKPVKYEWKGNLDSSVRATLEDVKDRDQAKTVLVDVRPADLYSGEKGTWKRPGHIQGAVNFPWANNLKNDGTWIRVNRLKKTYMDMGLSPEKTIIVSCGQGLMASHAYFTIKYILGYPDVKLYDGSFTEWTNFDALPVERSPNKESEVDGRD